MTTATYSSSSSLEPIFKKSLPANPTLLESLSSWKPIKNSMEDSFTEEIFGELHHKENPIPHPPPHDLERDVNGWDYYPYTKLLDQYGDGFLSMNSESLSMCTEELGSESSGDVEEWCTSGGGSDKVSCWDEEERRMRAMTMTNHCSVPKRLRTGRKEFPPPISCISKTGKPWVHFERSRENGRLIVKEIRIPTREYLHVYRENGRLNMTFVYSESDDDDIEEEEEEFGLEENVGDGNREDMIEVGDSSSSFC